MEMTNDDKSCIKFEYDNQNRITKVTNYNQEGDISSARVFVYNNAGELASQIVDNFTYTCTKNGNKITFYSGGEIYVVIDLNAEGLPIKMDSDYYFIEYKYMNGNVSEFRGCWKESSCDNLTYTYDDKKSPFYYSKTPKWVLVYCLGYDIKNNTNKHSGNVEYDYYTYTYSYTYNEFGFPLTRTTTVKVMDLYDNEVDLGITETRTYKYEQK